MTHVFFSLLHRNLLFLLPQMSSSFMLLLVTKMLSLLSFLVTSLIFRFVVKFLSRRLSNGVPARVLRFPTLKPPLRMLSTSRTPSTPLSCKLFSKSRISLILWFLPSIWTTLPLRLRVNLVALVAKCNYYSHIFTWNTQKWPSWLKLGMSLVCVGFACFVLLYCSQVLFSAVYTKAGVDNWCILLDAYCKRHD